MALELDSSEPFAGFLLDEDDCWQASGKRPDGVVVTQHAVCFIELKGSIDPTDPDRPFEQVLAGARHFCPVEARGIEHHRRFADDDDLPSAPSGRRFARLRPPKAHPVAGAIVVGRGGTRHPPRDLTLGERTLRVFVVQRHGRAGRVAMTLDELLRSSGL